MPASDAFVACRPAYLLCVAGVQVRACRVFLRIRNMTCNGRASLVSRSDLLQRKRHQLESGVDKTHLLRTIGAAAVLWHATMAISQSVLRLPCPAPELSAAAERRASRPGSKNRAPRPPRPQPPKQRSPSPRRHRPRPSRRNRRPRPPQPCRPARPDGPTTGPVVVGCVGVRRQRWHLVKSPMRRPRTYDKDAKRVGAHCVRRPATATCEEDRMDVPAPGTTNDVGRNVYQGRPNSRRRRAGCHAAAATAAAEASASASCREASVVAEAPQATRRSRYMIGPGLGARGKLLVSPEKRSHSSSSRLFSTKICWRYVQVRPCDCKCVK